MGALDRSLDALGVDPELVLEPKVDTLRALLLIHVALRALQIARLPEFFAVSRGGFVVAATLAALLGLLAWSPVSGLGAARRAQIGRLGATLATAQLAIQVGISFPFIPNHLFLELLCCGLLTIYGAPRSEDRQLLLTAVRWIAALVLLWTGIQKLWWGTWDHGEFLAAAIAERDSFATFMAPLLSTAELQQLRGMELTIGGGPLRLEGGWGLALSNLTWILEIALPLGMLWPRSRSAAVGGAVGLVCLIELAARELFFGLLFVQLLLVIPPGRTLQRSAPLLLGLYGLLALALAGGLPLGRFN
ncbi:MAG TPA: hypothetical protein ENK18_00175 [Deltaproteobacteria bacterium]|nr:hypothetical protein [Deltaproteobacteria bacterium]